MCVVLPGSEPLMNSTRLHLVLVVATSLLLGACASVSHHEDPTPASVPATAPAAPIVESVAQYVPERDADEVARMRANPAPESATIEDGSNFEADDDRLGMAGYVRIGHGVYRGDPTFVRDSIALDATDAGAEQVRVYAPAATSATAGDAPGADAWGAIFYVRYRLAFGATFRDLRDEERATLGGKGGVEIGTVMGGTPAARANLMAGDYVIAFNERPLADKAAFQSELRANAGRSITLTIVRQGETSQRIVRLGEAPAAASPQR